MHLPFAHRAVSSRDPNLTKQLNQHSTCNTKKKSKSFNVLAAVRPVGPRFVRCLTRPLQCIPKCTVAIHVSPDLEHLPSDGNQTPVAQQTFGAEAGAVDDDVELTDLAEVLHFTLNDLPAGCLEPGEDSTVVIGGMCIL